MFRQFMLCALGGGPDIHSITEWHSLSPSSVSTSFTWSDGLPMLASSTSGKSTTGTALESLHYILAEVRRAAHSLRVQFGGARLGWRRRAKPWIDAALNQGQAEPERRNSGEASRSKRFQIRGCHLAVPEACGAEPAHELKAENIRVVGGHFDVPRGGEIHEGVEGGEGRAFRQRFVPLPQVRFPKSESEIRVARDGDDSRSCHFSVHLAGRHESVNHFPLLPFGVFGNGPVCNRVFAVQSPDFEARGMWARLLSRVHRAFRRYLNTATRTIADRRRMGPTKTCDGCRSVRAELLIP
jgi:hypothetical protein